MGYYADYSGFIKTRFLSEEETKRMCERLEYDSKRSIEDLAGEVFDNVYISEENKDGKTSYILDINGFDKYRDDEVINFLANISEFVEEGEIEYAGEDYSRWRFHFRNGEWYEDSGETVYINSTRPIKG